MFVIIEVGRALVADQTRLDLGATEMLWVYETRAAAESDCLARQQREEREAVRTGFRRGITWGVFELVGTAERIGETEHCRMRREGAG